MRIGRQWFLGALCPVLILVAALAAGFCVYIKAGRMLAGCHAEKWERVHGLERVPVPGGWMYRDRVHGDIEFVPEVKP